MELEIRTTWKSNRHLERIVFDVRGSTVFIVSGESWGCSTHRGKWHSFNGEICLCWNSANVCEFSPHRKRNLGYCKQIRTLNYVTLFKDFISNRNVSVEYPLAQSGLLQGSSTANVTTHERKPLSMLSNTVAINYDESWINKQNSLPEFFCGKKLY